MILVFFVSLYFLNLLQQQHIFRDFSPYRPCQELNFLLAILISDLVMQIIRIYGMYINLEQAHTVF